MIYSHTNIIIHTEKNKRSKYMYMKIVKLIKLELLTRFFFPMVSSTVDD